MKQKTFQQQITRIVSKRMILTGIIIAIIAFLVVWFLFSPPMPDKKIAVVLASERKDITPFFYQGFDMALLPNPNIFPIKVSMISDSMGVKKLSDKEAQYQIDDTTSYKGRASLRIDAQGSGIGFRVKDFNSSDISVSICARTEKGQKGHLKIGFREENPGAQQEVQLIKYAREVDYIWQRSIHGWHFPQKTKDIIIIIVNADDKNPLWIDELNIRREIVSNREIITGRTISALDTLGVNYEILPDEGIKVRAGEFSALLIPYYETALKEVCAGGLDIPVYVVHCDPKEQEMPPAVILRSNNEVEYQYLEKKGYEFPFVGQFQTIDLQDADTKPLLWQSGNSQKVISWKYKNVMWNTFPVNYVGYIYVLGRLVQDLNLVVSPFPFVLDIDDINTPFVPAAEIQKLADFLRQKNWCTHLGIKPEYLRYLEPESIDKARDDAGLKKQLELEAEQVKVILENSDVFIPMLHAHNGTRWLAPAEKEQSEAYLNLLAKLRRYGFRIEENSYGYIYFPCNEFNEVTVDYLPRIGVHIARTCLESFPKFENHYYQREKLTIIPSDCPINAKLQSIEQLNQLNKNPVEYFAETRWLFMDLILNKKVVFIHGDNFSDGILGFKALNNIVPLVEGSRIAFYARPYDLRDKYRYSFKILSQQKGHDKTILTFDRELTGQKLLSAVRPVQRAINDRGEDIILFDHYIFCGVGQRLELYHNLSSFASVPKLKKISNNAFLRYALYKDGKITMEFEGYGNTEISLANLGKSTSYLVSNKCLADDKVSNSIQTASAGGELNFQLSLFSYNSVVITSSNADVRPAR